MNEEMKMKTAAERIEHTHTQIVNLMAVREIMKNKLSM